MVKKKPKLKKPGKKFPFMRIPKYITSSDAYLSLNGWAVKLLIDIFSQYNGYNNGDLSMTWSLMQSKGWKSKDTLYKARKRLIESGLIVQTRQGGLHQPSLYAVTWESIDECRGKHDYSPTEEPPHDWMHFGKKSSAPHPEPACPVSRTSVPYPRAN